MSEIQPSSNNRVVMYLAVAVVVLLVAFVAVVITLSGGSKTAETPSTGTPSVATTDTSQAGMAPSNTGFDPATATKVAADSDPKKHAAAYYQAILDKKFDVAFKMQPATSQVGKSVAAFQQTQEQMYGMTSFEIASSDIGAEEATVVVAQTLMDPNGVWTATWTFVKDGDIWLVNARVVKPGAPGE